MQLNDFTITAPLSAGISSAVTSASKIASPVASSSPSAWDSIGKAISDIGTKYVDFRAQSAQMKYDAQNRAMQSPKVPVTFAPQSSNSNMLIYAGLALVGVFLVVKLSDGGKK